MNDDKVCSLGFLSIYDGGDQLRRLAYDLLAERKPEESISHRVMPTWEQHVAFIASRPYPEWWVICDGTKMVGCVYLTAANEIGIGVLREHRRKGYACRAVGVIADRHRDKRLLANINPANEASIALFRKLGFTGPVQVTYERRQEECLA